MALVHDWLTGMRGGERCLEAFCEMFPDAPIYTLICMKEKISPRIRKHHIIASYLNRLPYVQRRYRYFLPLFPSAMQSFELDPFDLILSSSHCVAKGVRVPDNTCHIAYVHTPMRYIWEGHDSYFKAKRDFGVGEMGLEICRKYLQRWDQHSNDRVHTFVANSHNVAARIKRHYGREALVLHPPVDWHAFDISNSDEGFYLVVTAFAPYKRVDLAIQAANQMGLPLKIVGTGQDETYLRNLAGPNVEFLGWRPDDQVRELYRKCRALLFPGEEDFGIVPLEAMASGKPVIAYGKGGILETVVPVNPSNPVPKYVPPTGVFFYEQTVEGLIGAIRQFEKQRTSFEAKDIRAHVESFDRTYFKRRMQQIISTSYEQFLQSRTC